ncbi:MAG: hypothetical protein A2275_16465 [Bacteroidetes bacterium RIFOXYA12_FULL_35_11]|nr:MAG: hypothetical protein A2X01_01325 [Bacteroidetes bacterium GWF2_35_48]OFY80599.1 MAG: hypothetical protein A2275_16465 [Bacteroidetes bacterium RIFOXYA12_FULL_35_11]HBX51218.1 hypothetical protein [Bacteroidales bacterium]
MNLYLKKIAVILILTVLSLTHIMGQEVQLNDEFYNRMFRKNIVVPTTLDSVADKTGKIDPPKNYRWALEAQMFSKTKLFGGMVGSVPFVTKNSPFLRFLNFDFGYLAYKRPYAGITDADNAALTGSAGVSIHSRFYKIFLGGSFRAGNNLFKTVTPDTTIWNTKRGFTLSPYLYIDIPIKKFSLSVNAIPSYDFKSLAQFGLFAGLNYLKISSELYTERIKNPFGYDYDTGYEFIYILGDAKDLHGQIKARLGKYFSVDETIGETLKGELNNNDNAYVLAEVAFLYGAGLCYHKTNGFGWRMCLDLPFAKYNYVTVSYLRNYVLPTSFTLQPEKNMFYILMKFAI